MDALFSMAETGSETNAVILRQFISIVSSL